MAQGSAATTRPTHHAIGATGTRPGDGPGPADHRLIGLAATAGAVGLGVLVASETTAHSSTSAADPDHHDIDVGRLDGRRADHDERRGDLLLGRVDVVHLGHADDDDDPQPSPRPTTASTGATTTSGQS